MPPPLRARQSLFNTNNKKAQEDAEIVARLAATFDDYQGHDSGDREVAIYQDRTEPPGATHEPVTHEAAAHENTLNKVAKQKKRPESKYLKGLLRVARLRQAEREAIKEAMVQKERDEEDPSLKEKPVYVTKGYMRRLKEREAAINELQAGTHKS